MKRRIVPGGILALGLAVVLLAATASSASASSFLEPWYCPSLSTSPTAIDQVPPECRHPSDPPDGVPPVGVGDPFGGFEGFGDRQVGTTSPAQGFALAVFCVSACNDTLTPNISVSGDYAQTNNCPPTLSATGPRQVQGCMINVTLAPTGTGPRHGTLSTGPGGLTVALTGTGVTTPTPWDWPLELKADAALNPPRGVLPARDETLEKREPKVPLVATTNNDSTVVVSGGVKKTKKQLKAREETKFKAKLNLKRLNLKPAKVKGVDPDATTEIKFAATDEFGETATEKIKVMFCVGTRRDCT